MLCTILFEESPSWSQALLLKTLSVLLKHSSSLAVPLSWQVNTDKEDILFFTTKLKGLKGHSALYVACMHILEQKCQLVEPVVELDSAR